MRWWITSLMLPDQSLCKAWLPSHPEISCSWNYLDSGQLAVDCSILRFRFLQHSIRRECAHCRHSFETDFVTDWLMLLITNRMSLPNLTGVPNCHIYVETVQLVCSRSVVLSRCPSIWAGTRVELPICTFRKPDGLLLHMSVVASDL